MSAKFGVAKVYDNQILDYLTTLRNRGVDVLEVGFTDRMTKELLGRLVKHAGDLGISLSCHLPFTINLGDERSMSTCVRRLSQGIRFVNLTGGLAVFHLGFYGRHSFGEVKPNLLEAIKQALAEEPRGKGRLGIETTGKKTEMGSLDEILLLVKEVDSDALVPVIDWAHIYARAQGAFPRSLEDFAKILNKIKEGIAPELLYCHVSGIEFGRGGERRHISAKTCSPPMPYLMRTLKNNQVRFQMIVESPDPLEDVAWLKGVLNDPERWFPFVEQRMKESQKGLDMYFH